MKDYRVYAFLQDGKSVLHIQRLLDNGQVACLLRDGTAREVLAWGEEFHETGWVLDDDELESLEMVRAQDSKANLLDGTPWGHFRHAELRSAKHEQRLYAKVAVIQERLDKLEAKGD